MSRKGKLGTFENLLNSSIERRLGETVLCNNKSKSFTVHLIQILPIGTIERYTHNWHTMYDCLYDALHSTIGNKQSRASISYKTSTMKKYFSELQTSVKYSKLTNRTVMSHKRVPFFRASVHTDHLSKLVSKVSFYSVFQINCRKLVRNFRLLK